MRRNDAPGERGALADAGAAGTDAAGRGPDGGAGDLRQRLAGLRAGHPSSPEFGRDEDEPDAGDGERDGVADGGAEDPDAAEGEPDGAPGLAGPGPGGYPGGRGPAPAGRAELGRPGPLGGREPYRPWFSSGDSLEPWFTGDPGDPPG
jgi:hypothetical protein